MMKHLKKFREYINPQLFGGSCVAGVILITLWCAKATKLPIYWMGTPIYNYISVSQTNGIYTILSTVAFINILYALMVWADKRWTKKSDTIMAQEFSPALHSEIKHHDANALMKTLHEMKMAKLRHYLPMQFIKDIL